MRYSAARHQVRATRSLADVGGSRDLLVLLAWLAVFGVALRLLAGWPAAPALPEAVPSWTAIQVWIQSPSASPAGLLSWADALAWAVWLWTCASVLLRLVVDFADALTRGARWVRSVRLVSDWLTLPVVRRAVDASLAGVMLARVLTSTAVVEASPSDVVAVQTTLQRRPTAGEDRVTTPLWMQEEMDPQSGQVRQRGDSEVVYTVRPGDTLSDIALAFYGDAEQEDRIFQTNLGRVQSDGRQLNRHGLILPGWTLTIPEPKRGIVERTDGARWYVVKRGDTLWRIAADLLGDEERYRNLFDLNVGQASVGDGGPVLERPDLIWPGLRLLLPEDPPAEDAASTVAAEPQTPVTPEPSEPAASPTPTAAAAVVAIQSTPEPATEAPVTPQPIVSTQTQVAVPTPPAFSPTLVPPAPVRSDAGRRAGLSPEEAALLGGGVAAAIAAGALVVRRRRRSPVPAGPETDVLVERGFAAADPVEDLARRLARTADPPGAIASLLGQAYLAVFDEQLSVNERRDATMGILVAGTRHGRTSTTVVLAAPVPARPHLVRYMRAAAERAFGEHVDVDGLVSQDGDVLVRITWDQRHPVSARVLELVGPDAGPSLWPAPCLVSPLVLYDRQEFDLNWRSVSNVLIASPAGQGAEIPLTSLVASLASVRRPEDLGLVLLARPHMLPAELGRLPHVLVDSVDCSDAAAIDRALTSVRQELDGRVAAAGVRQDTPDLVLVVRELADLQPEACNQLGAVAAAGPSVNIRVIAASERPVHDLVQVCPFLGDFGTRLVLQATDEEESVALIGMPGAEDLGSGGHALLRFESRIPVQGWARQVPAEHLARLSSLMGTRSSHSSGAQPADRPIDVDRTSEQSQLPEELEPEGEELPTAQERTDRVQPALPSVVSALPWRGSPLLRRLRAAPIRVRCFGARGVWHGERELEIADTELLLLLAAHPIAGIKNDSVVDMLWEEEPGDPSAALRKRRFRLRDELRRAVPDLAADPFPGDMSHGERVVTMNPDVISSDVHEFLELLTCARTLDGPEAIQAYEEALSLYEGDLLDRADVPNYRWMYDNAQVALTLRSDYQRMQRDARLHLADLLAAGDDSGLIRAAELYTVLCGEEPEDERLWIGLFRVYERAGDLLGLGRAERQLRQSLVELAPSNANVNPDTVALPPKLDRLLQDIRTRLSDPRSAPTSA